ncbi:cold-shock protein [Brucella pseudogrignonensis]|uniref:cold-shock protein n=1 Tax=Brucella pseudogrignonensis TaxID=419475 RepID=UPI003ECD993D
MPTGKLYRYNSRTGYGFIQNEHNGVFVHASSFEKANIRPELGRFYNYEVIDREGRTAAVNLSMALNAA